MAKKAQNIGNLIIPNDSMLKEIIVKGTEFGEDLKQCTLLDIA